MAAIEMQSNALIKRTHFPLIKEKSYFRLLDNEHSNIFPAQITNESFENSQSGDNEEKKSIKHTPWIGSGAMKGCCFYIAFTHEDESAPRYLIAHALPGQLPPEDLKQHKSLVFVTSSASDFMENFDSNLYQSLKNSVQNFRHFHIEVEPNGANNHIYVYFNTESGALCIESADALYMSKEPLYSPSPYNQDLQNLKKWLIESTCFQKRPTHGPFFPNRNRTNSHAKEMSQAHTFEDIRNTARRALMKKPFLGKRDELVTEYYERLANSASAGEFRESISSYNASFEPILGSNKERDSKEYVAPQHELHRTNFMQTFGNTVEQDEGNFQLSR